jgi:uncharacterized protein (DUF111 family)
VLGDAATGGTEEVWQLETNLDNLSPEIVGYALDRCFAAGALDAWLVPVHMKKNRPGVVFSALADQAAVEAVEKAILEETRTLGVRRHRVSRTRQPRTVDTVATRFGKIRLKVRDGRSATPEFEDCRRAAESRGVPIPEVYEAALAGWSRGRKS